MSTLPQPPSDVVTQLRRGVAIPAHPLALTATRKLDERRQRALTRYYCDAGAGGLAVAVHTTQFAIRSPQVNLLEPVLALASETIDESSSSSGKTIIKIAGVIGATPQALREARLAADLGYHLALVSLGALREASNDELIAHLSEIAEIIPTMGFYLQPAVGGRVLRYEFWQRAAEIENLLAIKMAPFNRYQTLEVVRAVSDAGRADSIALYTGNDDNIVADLLSVFRFGGKQSRSVGIVGGLLGHWAVWTRNAVHMLQEIHAMKDQQSPIPSALLMKAQQITDANAALFDPHNNFAGCIPGIHEILRRQGLLAGRWTLDPHEELSPGQINEIDRVCAAYPHLQDDEFVKENLDRWLN